MVNCTVTIHKDTDTLSAGQRSGSSPTYLFAGPAYVSAPSRGWERAAALEGMLSGTLSVHSSVNLMSATRVELADHHMAGSWLVADVGVSGAFWRLTLQRRP